MEEKKQIEELNTPHTPQDYDIRAQRSIGQIEIRLIQIKYHLKDLNKQLNYYLYKKIPNIRQINLIEKHIKRYEEEKKKLKIELAAFEKSNLYN